MNMLGNACLPFRHRYNTCPTNILQDMFVFFWILSVPGLKMPARSGVDDEPFLFLPLDPGLSECRLRRISFPSVARNLHLMILFICARSRKKTGKSLFSILAVLISNRFKSILF